jgi:hypothetical protein
MTKYGKVETELKKIPEGEPVFLLRGQDVLAPVAIEMYANLLRAAAAGFDRGEEEDWGALLPDGRVDGTNENHLRDMAAQVSSFAAGMIAWQASNPDRVKLPD